MCCVRVYVCVCMYECICVCVLAHDHLLGVVDQPHQALAFQSDQQLSLVLLSSTEVNLEEEERRIKK